MQVHISSFDEFACFKSYFDDIVKTDDKEKLNEWLLKVLFWEFKHGREQLKKKHDFDKLIELVKVNEPNKALGLEKWLEKSLKEAGGK